MAIVPPGSIEAWPLVRWSIDIDRLVFADVTR